MTSTLPYAHLIVPLRSAQLRLRIDIRHRHVPLLSRLRITMILMSSRLRIALVESLLSRPWIVLIHSSVRVLSSNCGWYVLRLAVEVHLVLQKGWLLVGFCPGLALLGSRNVALLIWVECWIVVLWQRWPCRSSRSGGLPLRSVFLNFTWRTMLLRSRNWNNVWIEILRYTRSLLWSRAQWSFS